MKIPNSAVALLVAAAMVVSVAGTMTTLNVLDRISSLSKGDLTGYITGKVNVTVNESVALSFVVSVVNFSVLNTPESGLAYNDTTWDFVPPPFIISNDGSTTLNVTIYSNNNLWTNAPSPTGNFTFKCGDNLTTCDTDGGSPGSKTAWDPINASSGNAELAIWNMSYAEGVDRLEVHINVSVPRSEPSGSKESSIILTGAQACPGDAECAFEAE